MRNRSNPIPSLALCGLLLASLTAGLCAQEAAGPDPKAYLPKIRFAGHDDPAMKAQKLDGEQYLPVAYDFDGDSDLTNNVAHYKVGSHGGRQQATVYFHRAAKPATVNGQQCTVYEYWFYFVRETFPTARAHDWEAYFVYLPQGSPAGQFPQPVSIAHTYYSHLHVLPHSRLALFSNTQFPQVKLVYLQADGGSHALRSGTGMLAEMPEPDNLADLVALWPKWKGKPWKDFAKVLDGRQTGLAFSTGEWNLVRVSQTASLPASFGTVPAPWARREWNEPPGAPARLDLAGATRVAEGEKNVTVQPTQPAQPPKPATPPEQPPKPEPPQGQPPKPPQPQQPPPIPPQTPTPQPGQVAPPIVTAPKPQQKVPRRVEVIGTAPPGMLVICNIDAFAFEDGQWKFVKEIAGARRVADQQGNFKIIVAAPKLWNDLNRPVSYVFKVWCETDTGAKSQEVRIPCRSD